MTFASRRSRPRFAIACAVALGASLLAAPLLACIWDTDTLAQEAKGELDAVRVIVGFFPRNPRLYYEMRVDRSAADIAVDPDNLAAYDDAGASCDRLGRGDEAIVWMEKKLERLDALAARGKEDAEHRYRYLANVGTFWAHRWFAQGQDRERIEEMRTAAEFIRQAIALNPDAHFGREKYQLMAMEWIIDPPLAHPHGDEDHFQHVPSFLVVTPDLRGRFFQDTETIPSEGLRDAVKGVAGLVALGNAWESIDAFQALALALRLEGRTAVSHLALHRMAELRRQGRQSLYPSRPFSLETINMGDFHRLQYLDDRLAFDHETKAADEAAAWYAEAREAAKEYHWRRLGYMTPRLEAGRHPDTDPTFWDDYVEVEMPLFKEPPPSKPRRRVGRVEPTAPAETAATPSIPLALLAVALMAIGVSAAVLGKPRRP